MMGQALDEAVEGGPMRECAEAAEVTEIGVVLQATNQGIGVRQVEDKGGNIGLPQGFERVALASCRAVLLETG